MRSVTSEHLTDLTEIYADDVELISVRPNDGDEPLAAKLEASLSRPLLQARWSQAVSETSYTSSMLGPEIDAATNALLTREIDRAIDVLSTLLDCPAVGVRIASLRAPMCPKFHIDHVPCRMLITLMGAGTEWIAHDDVDHEQLADRISSAMPLRTGGSVRHLDTGSWTLMKGGAWQDQFNGVVHRSPADENGRLLLSLDPLFDKEQCA